METLEINKQKQANSLQAVGRVVATEKNPNTAQSFSFWTNLDSPVGIGTIVKIESDRVYTDKNNKEIKRIVYGIVNEGISYTDLETPMHDYISSDFEPGIQAILHRQKDRKLDITQLLC